MLPTSRLCGLPPNQLASTDAVLSASAINATFVLIIYVLIVLNQPHSCHHTLIKSFIK